MRSFWARRAYPSCPSPVHPALTSFADECTATFARLLAYVGTLALFVMFGVHLWDQLPIDDVAEPAAAAGWSLASHSRPAFAVSQFDLLSKTETYDVFRHPAGGRKNVIRWTAAGEGPAAELEIYRPGGEPTASEPALDLAARMDGKSADESTNELEAAGVIDSKFGSVMLFRHRGEADAQACLAFLKQLDDPHLQISGWSCQGASLQARRAQIGCMLSRLMLLTAGGEPKLAELFARAELKRADCASVASAPGSADWVTSAEGPGLRGAM
jgi:hypothetical protein